MGQDFRASPRPLFFSWDITSIEIFFLKSSITPAVWSVLPSSTTNTERERPETFLRFTTDSINFPIASSSLICREEDMNHFYPPSLKILKSLILLIINII